MSSAIGGTSINRLPLLVGKEFLGIAPPVAGVAGAAAAADHVHPVAAASAAIQAFGKMLQMLFNAAQFGDLPTAALFPETPMNTPPEWTIECFTTNGPAALPNANEWGYFIGWSTVGAGSLPQTPGAFGPLPGYTGLYVTTGGGCSIMVDGAQIPVPGTPSGPAALSHTFLQLDGAGNFWAGVGGVVYGPYPSGGGIPPQGFPIYFMQGEINAGAPSYTEWLDELRVSSTTRYPLSAAPYVVPIVPFIPDQSTILLYALDDIPYGAFLTSAGNGLGVWVKGAKTLDSSTNGIPGNIWINDTVGQSTGTGNTCVLSAIDSTVTPGSGTGQAASVETVQGVTGNILLLDTGGGVIPVAADAGAEAITVATVSGGAGDPAAWVLAPVA